MPDGVTVFRGIPFATAERFRPPRVLPLDAMPPPGQPFGPPAAQLPDRLDYIWGDRLAPGSENCLSLNVWTPDPTAKLPVLFWLHGGAFIIGGSRWAWYDGAKIAAEQNVVVVTANYRLGAFGFLDVSDLGGADYAESGNSGLLDQIAALEWVKANAHRFGGDAENVTLGGQSAGGISVGCLMACPRAKGLFRRAIVMSGPPTLIRSKAFAKTITARFLRASGAATIDDLLRLPLKEVLRAQRQTLLEADFVGEQAFAPTVGDAVLPEWPQRAVAAGSASGVPLLCGSTADEMRLWTLYNPVLWKVPFGGLGAWFARMGLRAGAMKAAYRRARPGVLSAGIAATGDALFWMPQVRLAEAQAKHAETWAYLFRWESKAGDGRLGATHAADMPLLFDTATAPGAEHIIGHPADGAKLGADMRALWGAFVRTGNPNADGLPAWPAFDATTRSTMILNTTSAAEGDPLQPVREAWDSLPFDGVTPSPQDLPRIGDFVKYAAVWAGAVLLGVLLAAGVTWWLLTR